MNKEEFKDYVIEDLLKTFKWLDYDKIYGDIIYNDCIVVHIYNLDVNYECWHKCALKGHKTFNFDSNEPVKLTPDNYEEFKDILLTWGLESCLFSRDCGCDMCGKDAELWYYSLTGEEVCDDCKGYIMRGRIRKILEIGENNE